MAVSCDRVASSHIFSSCCILFNTFISKIQYLCYICSPPLRHLFLSSHLLTDLTSYLLSLLLSSHLFLYLLHHFYILNHQKLTFMFYIYKLNIYIFSFSRSRATRRPVLHIHCCTKQHALRKGKEADFLKHASALEDWCVLEQMCTGANTGFL